MKEFKKIMELLAYSRSYVTIFSDFLDYCLYVLTAGYIRDDFERLNKEYSPEEIVSFREMLLLLGAESEQFNDALGDIFMDYVSHGHNGQYFTPDCITDFMAQILGVDESKAKETICDPCCGSGRMLLSAAKLSAHVNDNIRPFCYGADMDLTCVKMTTINMLLNTIPGEVAWMNSLSLEHWRSYKIDLIRIGDIWLPSLKVLSAGQTTFVARLERTLQSQPEEVKEQVKKRVEAKQLTLF